MIKVTRADFYQTVNMHGEFIQGAAEPNYSLEYADGIITITNAKSKKVCVSVTNVSFFWPKDESKKEEILNASKKEK